MQDLDSLVRAATFLRDRDDLRIVIAGFGARHAEMVTLADTLEVDDMVRFLPYQKRERLPLSLSSADVHVVGLAKDSRDTSSRVACTGFSPPAGR